MPIPYMGSKRKSAQMIFQTIKNFNPNADTIVDLFCGGFAISEIFIDNRFKVISNDKNKYVVALIDQVVNKGLDKNKCLEFVSRESFKEALENQNKHEDWYIGYLMCCWTFGNNQKGYLYGKEVEKTKIAGHELVVNNNQSKVTELIPKKYVDGILNQKDWYSRRIALVKVARALKDRIYELQHLQHLQHLEHLERLERLERLQRLDKIVISSKSYDEIDIPKDAIVYCDPPYQGTAEYKEGSFNHKEFWEWARKISRTNKLYISEYNAPSDFKPILSFEQKSTLQGGTQKHNNQPMERLFVPIGQEKFRYA